MAVAVEGCQELNRTFKHAPKDVRPRSATSTAPSPNPSAPPPRRSPCPLSSIRRIGPKWSQMRTGVTQTARLCRAPQRGVKTRGYDPRRRGSNSATCSPNACPSRRWNSTSTGSSATSTGCSTGSSQVGPPMPKTCRRDRRRQQVARAGVRAFQSRRQELQPGHHRQMTGTFRVTDSLTGALTGLGAGFVGQPVLAC